MTTPKPSDERRSIENLRIEGELRARGCGCPCHQVVQPGLVPCPRCERSEQAFPSGPALDAGVPLRDVQEAIVAVFVAGATNGN